jgi:hypothetical protein
MGYLFHVAQDQAQVPTLHPELIAGPWESVSTSGIDGIFFDVETSSVGQAGDEQIAWQMINIRVYHRQKGKETGGWFATNDKASAQSYSLQDDHAFTLFDGERLRIHFPDATDLKPFDLDITFSDSTHGWTGTWSRSGEAFNVVLERPSPGGDRTPSGFVGDWNGELNSAADTPGSIHIRESRDGALSAWLDRTISGMDRETRSVHRDQRNGELLRVSSMPGTGLILETSNWTGPACRYRGSLSEDQRVLAGNWENESGSRLNAPERFRRAP